jgi:alanine racemase
MTLPELLPQAYKEDISIAIATPEALQNILRSKHPPKFHIKIDTGLRRHGFLPEAVPSLLKQLTQHPRAARNLEGIFTHFARTGDAKGKKSTARQFAQFEEVRREFARAGFNNLICHCSATGGLLTSPAYHLNAVRLGIGLYGHYPNPGIEKEWAKTLRLRPALIWKSVVGETKIGSKGDAVGYDGTEVLNKKSLLAALPVGYWHGLPRAASSKGSVGIRGVAAKIAGRVSMDITVVHAPLATHLGDIATLIGMTAPTRAEDLAAVANTNHYEILTRLNPLIERILVS